MEAQVLTASIVGKRKKHRGSFDEFTSITDDAAALLAQYKGPLRLDGLTKLSVAAARIFSAHPWSVHLGGLTRLADEGAAAFATARFAIHLKGLTRFPGKPGHLALAEHWARERDRLTELHRIRTLDTAVAKALANLRGDIDLRGLTQLSDEAAEALSRHQGELDLSGLSALSEPAAAALARHMGGVHLRGLAELPDSPGHVALAGALARRDGLIRLDNLKSLPDRVAAALAKNAGALYLPGLTRLPDSPSHLALASALARQHTDVDLNKLKILPENIAIALASCRRGLYLQSVAALSDPAAFALAGFGADRPPYRGNDATFAKIMARYIDASDLLDLTGLKQVSPASACRLLANPRVRTSAAVAKRARTHAAAGNG